MQQQFTLDNKLFLKETALSWQRHLRIGEHFISLSSFWFFFQFWRVNQCSTRKKTYWMQRLNQLWIRFFWNTTFFLKGESTHDCASTDPSVAGRRWLRKCELLAHGKQHVNCRDWGLLSSGHFDGNTGTEWKSQKNHSELLTSPIQMRLNYLITSANDGSKDGK